MTNSALLIAFRIIALLCILSSSAFAQSVPASLRSAEDGWLDMSDFIDQAYGFLPIIIPITEPAVGLGAVAALAFIDKQNSEAGAGFGRPNISLVGGLATENGSRGLILGDIRYWLDDRLQTLSAASKAPLIWIITEAENKASATNRRKPTHSTYRAASCRPNTGSANRRTGLDSGS